MTNTMGRILSECRKGSLFQFKLRKGDLAPETFLLALFDLYLSQSSVQVLLKSQGKSYRFQGAVDGELRIISSVCPPDVSKEFEKLSLLQMWG